jgi:hypothetical protein
MNLFHPSSFKKRNRRLCGAAGQVGSDRGIGSGCVTAGGSGHGGLQGKLLLYNVMGQAGTPAVTSQRSSFPAWPTRDGTGSAA